MRLYQRIYDNNWNILADWSNVFIVNDYMHSQLCESDDNPLDLRTPVEYKDIEFLYNLVSDCISEILELGEAGATCMEIFPATFYDEKYIKTLLDLSSELLYVMYYMKVAESDAVFTYRATVEKN